MKIENVHEASRLLKSVDEMKRIKDSIKELPSDNTALHEWIRVTGEISKLFVHMELHDDEAVMCVAEAAISAIKEELGVFIEIVQRAANNELNGALETFGTDEDTADGH